MFFTCQLARSVTQLMHHIAAHPAVLRDQPLVAGPAVIQGQQAWLSATRPQLRGNLLRERDAVLRWLDNLLEPQQTQWGTTCGMYSSLS